MPLELQLNKDWSAAGLARHLQDFSILYRWEIVSEYRESFFALSQANNRYFSDFLLGHDLDYLLRAAEIADLELVSIHYGSPTTEVFEGAVRGLSGLAGLIERLIFFQQSRRTKEIDLEKLELELLKQKVDTIHYIRNLMLESGMNEDQIASMIRRYGESLKGLYSLIQNEDFTGVLRDIDSEIGNRIDYPDY